MSKRCLTVDELIEKVMARAMPSPGGCLLWPGSKTNNGYGTVWNGKRNILCHRVTYEANHGPIPDGLQIDHLCRNPPCCNPDHLEVVTASENALRGETGQWKRPDRCKHGHDYGDGNLIINKAGARMCRICTNEKYRRYRRRKREATNA